MIAIGFSIIHPASHDSTDEASTSSRSVANPQRTTWTGFAKDDTDRLPSS